MVERFIEGLGERPGFIAQPKIVSIITNASVKVSIVNIDLHIFKKEVPNLNYIQMITTLVDRVLPLMTGKKKKNNNGMIWASIIGIVISLAAVLIRQQPKTTNMKEPLQNMMEPIQKMVTNFRQDEEKRNSPNLMQQPAFAEFANEIKPNVNGNVNFPNTQNKQQ